eukprot:6225120-Alexandrium_andersonii.AAC.1
MKCRVQLWRTFGAVFGSLGVLSGALGRFRPVAEHARHRPHFVVAKKPVPCMAPDAESDYI